MGQKDGSFPWSTNLISIQVHDFLTVIGDDNDKSLKQNRRFTVQLKKHFTIIHFSKITTEKRNKTWGKDCFAK